MSAKPMELIRPDRTDIYSSPDEFDLEMHMFFPSSDHEHNLEHHGKSPAILFIHGGGFINGNPSQFFWHAQAAAQSGFFACSIAYRLSGAACFPAALIDSQNAVKYLRRNADQLNIDTHRIASFGSSAGAYLAAFLGISNISADTTTEGSGLSPQTDFVVNVHGPSDMRMGPDSEYRSKFMGATREENPDAYRSASPIVYVSDSCSPMLLMHDPDDDVVDFEHSRLLHEALRRHEVDVELYELSGTQHGFIYNPKSDQAKLAFSYAKNWLIERVYSTRQPDFHGKK